MNNKDVVSIMFERQIRNRYSIRRCLQDQIRSLQPDPSSIYTSNSILSFALDSASDRFLLCGSADSTVSILDLDGIPSSPIASTSKFHDGAIGSVQWYPEDNAIMFTGGQTDCVVNLWDCAAFIPVERFKMPRPINELCVSDKNTLVAVACEQTNVLLLDINSGSQVQQFKGHGGNISTVKWVPSDDNILVSADRSGEIIFWDVRSAKSKLKSFRSLKVGINSLCWSQRNDLISYDNIARCTVWNSATGKPYKLYEWATEQLKYQMKNGCMTIVDNFVFLTHGDYILVGDLVDGCLLNVLSGHFATVNCLQYRNCTKTLFTCANDQLLLRWMPT